MRFRGVDDRAEQVEACRELQSLSDRSHKLHCLGEELGVEVYDTTLVDASVEAVDVVGEFHSVVCYHVRRAACACCGVVAVFSHLVSGTCNHEARGGRDVESVFAVAAGAHHVDVSVAVQRHRHSRLQYSVAESQQFVHSDASHLQSSEQSRYLFVREFAFCYSHEYVSCFLPCQFLVIQHSVEYIFHCLHDVKILF